MTLPIIWVLPPTMLTATKSPRVSETVKIDPATTAGRTRGRTTERKVRQAWAPRSEDASSRESGSRSSPAKMGRIIRQPQVGQDQPDRGQPEPGAVQPDRGQGPVQHPAGADHHPPGVRLDQVA